MGASDAEQLAHAKREGRVLITRDHDFARMHTTDQDHAGIILWTQNCHFGQLIKDIDALCFEMSAEDFRGRLLFL